MTDLRRLRHEYAARGLELDEPPVPPMSLFRRWLHEALEAGLGEPNAMIVSTVSAQGAPSSRTVLLKGLVDDEEQQGFVFYTNHDSRKGRELAGEPRCALLFPWHDLERQAFALRADAAPEFDAADFLLQRELERMGQSSISRVSRGVESSS